MPLTCSPNGSQSSQAGACSNSRFEQLAARRVQLLRRWRAASLAAKRDRDVARVRPAGRRQALRCASQAHWRFVSLDELKLRVGGRRWDIDREVWRRALALRDSMLRSLATAKRGGWPTSSSAHRRRKSAPHGRRALGIAADHVIVLATPAETCIARLHADPARRHAVAELTNGVQRWHWLHGREGQRFAA